MSVTSLVVVEEAFAARGGGVVVHPRITVHDTSRAPFPVQLRHPDGSRRTATATLDVAHIRGPNGAYALVRILGVGVQDVPPGTEIWRAP